MADTIDSLKRRLTTATKQLDEQKRRVQELQDKQENTSKINAILQKQFDSSYTAEDLSVYLNQMIVNFNKSMENNGSQVKYIINSMDVDLKAQVFHDENGTLRFCAPNLENPTEESLSDIKISIRAIPN